MNAIKSNLALFPKGNPENTPIIFIHGFPFDHNMWNKQVDILSRTYFCVTYDLRGLGKSPVGDGQYTVEIFAEDVLYILEENRLKKPVLCGLSMGGYIALRTVEKSQNLFKALILCDTKSSADDNETKIKRAEGIRKINSLGVKKYVSEFIPNCFAEKSITGLGEEYKEILKRSSQFSPIGVKGCLLAMAGRTDTTQSLSKIKIPTLLLCGEEDKLIPADIMKDMAAKISGSETYIIPGAGHISPLENPSYTNTIIGEFLSKKI
jgi:3-oxoadipate enol-lactonase